ncbi:BBT_HP_G0132160.mRNA.1.CDS.1 [Saccharomyces cerevisiae]|nr:BBT_HP_G0132160.mRNA.1.CDS.1 [Saccharomyces cerevisiae]CAI6975826.1 BBT_HP_G0132160.mRNA.1.CDS.1 [Saccharomyces cerevisiae]
MLRNSSRSIAANKSRLGNLFIEYTSMKSKVGSGTQRDLFWSKVSSAFKKDFDISVIRGRPCGQVVVKNKDFIINTMKQSKKKSSDNSDYQSYLM